MPVIDPAAKPAAAKRKAKRSAKSARRGVGRLLRGGSDELVPGAAARAGTCRARPCFALSPPVPSALADPLADLARRRRSRSAPSTSPAASRRVPLSCFAQAIASWSSSCSAARRPLRSVFKQAGLTFEQHQQRRQRPRHLQRLLVLALAVQPSRQSRRARSTSRPSWVGSSACPSPMPLPSATARSIFAVASEASSTSVASAGAVAGFFGAGSLQGVARSGFVLGRRAGAARFDQGPGGAADLQREAADLDPGVHPAESRLTALSGANTPEFFKRRKARAVGRCFRIGAVIEAVTFDFWNTIAPGPPRRGDAGRAGTGGRRRLRGGRGRGRGRRPGRGARGGRRPLGALGRKASTCTRATGRRCWSASWGSRVPPEELVAEAFLSGGPRGRARPGAKRRRGPGRAC